MPETTKMDRKNMWFFTIFGLLILATVVVTFFKYYVYKDFQITAEVSCNPATEVCFHYAGVTCAEGDTECVPAEAYDYKIISKRAGNIYACEQTMEKIGCSKELSCLDGEEQCSYEYCTDGALSEGVTCTNTAN
jgi:hypothetical protein